MRIKHLMIIFAVIAALLFTLVGCGPDISSPDNSPAAEPSATASAAATEPAVSAETSAAEPQETLPADETSTEPAAAEAGFNVGNALPDFSVPLVGGGEFKLSENLGKPVFINMFATWCPPCVGEMPEINQLAKDFADQASFIAIDIGEDESTAKSFADSNGYTLPFAYSEDGMPFGDAYQIQSIPRTFILNADGTISAFYEGSRDYDTFKAAIQAALAH